MIDDSNKEELIELYLTGKLTGAVLTEFTEKLATDRAFKDEVENERKIIENIRRAGRKEWLSRVAGYHEEMTSANVQEQGGNNAPPIQSVTKWNSRKSWLVAAIAIGAMVISGIIYQAINSRPDSESIFIAYFQPYNGVEQGTRGGTGAKTSERELAFKAYFQNNYPESIKLFNVVLNKGDDETVLFYLGNAYLSDNRTADAENTFKAYLSKYTEFAVEAKWYLGLSQLKQKKFSAAKSTLQEVVKANNDFSKKAKEVLEKLE